MLITTMMPLKLKLSDFQICKRNCSVSGVNVGALDAGNIMTTLQRHTMLQNKSISSNIELGSASEDFRRPRCLED